MNSITLKNGTDWKFNSAYHGDWLDFAKNLPDKSVGLIMADPPYFEVKGEFDFIWESFEDYLKDVERWAIECKRILADNGSLFWWGNVEKIAYSQIILDKYFKFENHITWRKPDSMQYQYYSVELSRRFNTHNERCLFYSNEKTNESENNYKYNIGMANTNIMKPIIDYLIEEMNRSGLNCSKINKITGTKMASHWFSRTSQWSLPTKEWYLKLQEIFNGEYLKKDYEELRQDYEELRRPFNNYEKLEDVITHSQQSQISRQYEHDTIKAVGMIKKLLQTTTRKDTLVFIPFWGSGTDSEACHELGLNWIACEISEKHFKTAQARQKAKEIQPVMDF